MRALVTGVAGFLGSHLAERLLAADDEVIGVDSLDPYYPRAAKLANVERLRGDASFRFVEADVSGAELESLMAGVEVVYHLAGRPGVRGGWADEFSVYLHANVTATQRVLEAARGRELHRVVIASSSSVYGDTGERYADEATPPAPRSPYAVTKVATEGLARIYWEAGGVPVVCLRYFSIYGPRQRPDMAFSRFIERAVTGRPLPVYGDAQQVRDFTYVDDAVAATVAAGTRGLPGATYNVAGGSPASLASAIGILEDLLGHSLRTERRPAADGEPTAIRGDIELAHSQLGYRPRTPLEAGLARQLRERQAS